jgi:hypothetical protein
MCNYITKLHLYDNSGAKAYPALALHPALALPPVFLLYLAVPGGMSWYVVVRGCMCVVPGWMGWYLVVLAQRVPNRGFKAYPALVPHPILSKITLGTNPGQFWDRSGTVLGQI